LTLGGYGVIQYGHWRVWFAVSRWQISPLHLEHTSLQGLVISIPEVSEVVRSKAAQEVTQVLLEALPEDEQSMLMRQSRQLCQGSFLFLYLGL
jgi:hypothetical protein